MKRIFPLLVVIAFIWIILARLTTPQPKPVSNPPKKEPMKVQVAKIYLIKLDDNGKSGKQIGCGDSVVPIEYTILAGSDQLKSTLQGMLAVSSSSAEQKGLYTAFAHSHITVDHIDVADKTATVYLMGQLQLGGVCDDPRVTAQIEQTLLQFPEISKVVVFINNEQLSDVLSEKGN